MRASTLSCVYVQTRELTLADPYLDASADAANVMARGQPAMLRICQRPTLPYPWYVPSESCGKSASRLSTLNPCLGTRILKKFTVEAKVWDGTNP